MELSVKMRLIRKKEGMNQTLFGNSLGLEQGSYAGIENGRTKNLSKSVLILLKLIYKINPEWIETDSDDISDMYIEEKNKDLVCEHQSKYIKCEGCIERERKIKELEEIINAINKLTTKKQN